MAAPADKGGTAAASPPAGGKPESPPGQAQEPKADAAQAPREPAIPRERFDEVNTRMQTAERQAQALQQQVSALTQVVARTATSQPSGPDPALQGVKQPFRQGAVREDGTVNEDVAEQAFKAVFDTANYATKQALGGFKDEILRSVRDIIRGEVGPVVGTLAISGEVGQMIAQNKITQVQGQELTQRMHAEIQKQPGWAQPEYKQVLLQKTLGEMWAEGKMTPPAAPETPRMPFQPGGTGRPPETAPNNDAEFADIKGKFRKTFGGMTADQMKAIGVLPPDADTVQQVVGPDGQVHMVETSQIRGSYTHHRGPS